MGWMGKTGSREKCDAMVAAAVYVSPRRANVEGGGWEDYQRGWRWLVFDKTDKRHSWPWWRGAQSAPGAGRSNWRLYIRRTPHKTDGRERDKAEQSAPGRVLYSRRSRYCTSRIIGNNSEGRVLLSATSSYPWSLPD